MPQRQQHKPLTVRTFAPRKLKERVPQFAGHALLTFKQAGTIGSITFLFINQLHYFLFLLNRKHAVLRCKQE
jgi:hypothetical protein